MLSVTFPALCLPSLLPPLFPLRCRLNPSGIIITALIFFGIAYTYELKKTHSQVTGQAMGEAMGEPSCRHAITAAAAIIQLEAKSCSSRESFRSRPLTRTTTAPATAAILATAANLATTQLEFKLESTQKRYAAAALSTVYIHTIAQYIAPRFTLRFTTLPPHASID